MGRDEFPHIERNIARCRILLSSMAILAVYVDPTHPLMRPSSVPAWFSIDPYTLGALIFHLAYSVFAYYVVARSALSLRTFHRITTWGDVVIGAVIAFMTEGVSSPFYAFFVFAVVEVGIRAGLRETLVVTTVSVALYLSLIVISTPGLLNFYIMRPVYLAIVGYLVAYLGQQRLNLEAETRALAAADQRNRIARDLHDGWAQAFAGVNLRIETCRELLRRGRIEDATAQLRDLQHSVNREYDDLRGYMRSLAGLESAATSRECTATTWFSVRASFEGTGPCLDHVLQIMREGVSNVVRHAGARSASLTVGCSDGLVTIAIDDDGVGFRDQTQRPWSIASRVRELGGRIELMRDGRAGVHLAVVLPRT